MQTQQTWYTWVLQQVGAGVDPDVPDILTTAIGSIWDAWGAKGAVYPFLQALYAERHCIDILLGQLRNLTNASVPNNNPRQGERLKNLQQLRDNVSKEIAKLETQANQSRVACVAPLVVTAPYLPPNPGYKVFGAGGLPPGYQLPAWMTPPLGPCVPDPNDPAYQGSPQRATAPVIP